MGSTDGLADAIKKLTGIDLDGMLQEDKDIDLNETVADLTSTANSADAASAVLESQLDDDGIGSVDTSGSDSVLSSMHNDYLFSLQNKYNELQKENNTLLRNELSVIDENRRNAIKIKFSRKILLALFSLLVVCSLIYYLGGKNLALLGATSYLLIPIILLVILVFVYKNVVYFKKHSNINVNDLNTIPRSARPATINSTAPQAERVKGCLNARECLHQGRGSNFSDFQRNAGAQLRDINTSIGNINNYETTLNALNSHFSREQQELPMFAQKVNEVLRGIYGGLGIQNSMAQIEANGHDETAMRRIKSNMDKKIAKHNHKDTVKAIGREIDKYFRLENPNLGQYNMGSQGFEQRSDGDIQNALRTDQVYGISLNDYNTLSARKNYTKLGELFLRTQRLTNYVESFTKWVKSQSRTVALKIQARSDSLNKIGRPGSNVLGGHVGIY